ncbi:hypothetical protein GCM10018790_45920 [Kitasatospora xanthocidica]|nr:hypothetical protein GCM10018790_45920 [Kitasatospora xanthocidica]
MPPLRPSRTNPVDQADRVDRVTSRSGRSRTTGMTAPKASRALCAASPVAATSPAVTVQAPASGVASPRPTLRGLR